MYAQASQHTCKYPRNYALNKNMHLINKEQCLTTGAYSSTVHVDVMLQAFTRMLSHLHVHMTRIYMYVSHEAKNVPTCNLLALQACAKDGRGREEGGGTLSLQSLLKGCVWTMEVIFNLEVNQINTSAIISVHMSHEAKIVPPPAIYLLYKHALGMEEGGRRDSPFNLF